MKITIKQQIDVSACHIIPLFKDGELSDSVKKIDEEVQGLITKAKELKDFEGKAGEVLMLVTGSERLQRVVLVGLGKEKTVTIRQYKHAIGAGVMVAQKKKVNSPSVHMLEPLITKWGADRIAQETVIAAEMAVYTFEEHKEEKAKVTPMHMITLVTNKNEEVQQGAQAGSLIAQAINNARRLGNTPPSIMTPKLLAEEAQAVASVSDKLTVAVWEREKIESEKMGCFLGVAQGSEQDPRFIVMEYKGAEGAPTVLVGKGITFDSGGLSIKTGDYMCDMKFDMLGGATVIGIVQALAALDAPVHVVGLIPTCENMPSGQSYRPDDILTASNGKTVLIKNTDAEGRLILADALVYAQSLSPKQVIDFATLTGACLVALGEERSGLFSPVDSLVNTIVSATEKSGERLWRLPVGEEYSEAMKSDIADIKNIGGVNGSRYGGASTAAAFLEFFTKDKEDEPAYPWAHIDLSCSYYGKAKSYIKSGANGFGIQTFVDLLR